jgi:hypothetical protein
MTPPQSVVALGAREIASRVKPDSVEALLQKRWARVLVPSLLDLFFLAVLIWLFMSSGSAGWQGLLADADVGWHIRTGEYILDHKAVPRQDLYSFSKPGAAWYAWEWGVDLIDGALHRKFGLKGVVLLSAVIIAFFATTLIRRIVWRGSHLFVGLIVALTAVGGASIHFLARPHLFTLLLISLSVWMIESDRRNPTSRIWWLMPITVVWTNLHGGFLALIALLGVTTVGFAIETWLGVARWHSVKRYALLTGGCALASLVNPYGYQLHVHVAQYLRSDWIRNVIQEFQAPTFRNENLLQYEILVLIGVLVTGSLFRRKQIAEALWILFFAHMSLTTVRHVPLYVTIAGPIVAEELSTWWQMWTVKANRKSLPGIINSMSADSLNGFRRVSIWPFAVVTALVLMGPPLPWPKDFPAIGFPVTMVHAHEQELLKSRVLSTDQWGDYLIYTNPRIKVFVDGRSDFYGEEIGEKYLHMYSANWDWRKTMDEYKFNLVLLPVEAPLVQLLKISPDWQVKEDNGKEILLVRR